jgi:hypothetical protein
MRHRATIHPLISFVVCRIGVIGCPEGHSFCYICYTTILKAGTTTCPACRAAVHPGDLVRVRFMDDEMSKVLVRCQLLPAGAPDESRSAKRPRISC